MGCLWILVLASHDDDTAPHRRGGANQKDHRPHSTGGGGDKAKQDQMGKATRLNKTTNSPASYIHFVCLFNFC